METAKYTHYTRWVEVKFTDGTVFKGPKRPTAVAEGQPKPAIRADIAADWCALFAANGKQVTNITFRYRKR